MLVVIHLDAGETTPVDAERALSVLAARPGYLRGSAGPSVDDPQAWVLVTEWDRLGDYRRALGSYEVKLHAQPLLAQARDLPSAFEQLIDVAPGGAVARASSDRAQ